MTTIAYTIGLFTLLVSMFLNITDITRPQLLSSTETVQAVLWFILGAIWEVKKAIKQQGDQK